LVSTNVAGEQGTSVALSADGNTAIVGDPGANTFDNGVSAGAAWVYTRSNGVRVKAAA
jgi:hypothetical protein